MIHYLVCFTNEHLYLIGLRHPIVSSLSNNGIICWLVSHLICLLALHHSGHSLSPCRGKWVNSSFFVLHSGRALNRTGGEFVLCSLVHTEGSVLTSDGFTEWAALVWTHGYNSENWENRKLRSWLHKFPWQNRSAAQQCQNVWAGGCAKGGGFCLQIKFKGVVSKAPLQLPHSFSDEKLWCESLSHTNAPGDLCAVPMGTQKDGMEAALHSERPYMTSRSAVPRRHQWSIRHVWED